MLTSIIFPIITFVFVALTFFLFFDAIKTRKRVLDKIHFNEQQKLSKDITSAIETLKKNIKVSKFLSREVIATTVEQAEEKKIIEKNTLLSLEKIASNKNHILYDKILKRLLKQLNSENREDVLAACQTISSYSIPYFTNLLLSLSQKWSNDIDVKDFILRTIEDINA